MKNEIKHMKAAISLAEEALEKGELPIAAVIVLNDKIIASAHTMEKTSGRFLVHAESLALEQADKLKLSFSERQNCTLYTTLEPCLMCLGASMSFFIGKICYALESPGDGAIEIVNSWNKNSKDLLNYKIPIISKNILSDESKMLFSKYVEKHSKGAMWEWAKTLCQ